MIALPQRRRRAIGAGLTAYGLVGLAAGALVITATIAVGLAMQPTITSVDRQRDAVVAALESGASSLERTADLIVDSSGAVQSSSEVASEAANVSRRLADTLARLADTFGSFEILGSRPFGPLASDATQLAAQLRGIATDLDALGTRLGSISRSLPPLAEDVAATADELATVAVELAAFEVPEAALAAFAWLLVGVVLVAGWLLVPAVAALVAGIGLLRGPGETAA